MRVGRWKLTFWALSDLFKLMVIVVSRLNLVNFVQDMETGDWTAPPDAADVVSPDAVD